MQQDAHSTTERNVTGVLKYLREYLDLRFAHAGRLNDKFLQVQADLTWHELRSVGRVLRKTKPFAELRVAVADILVSFDDVKKRSLTYAKSQSQIMNEIVTIFEEKDMIKTGLLAIRDIRALYKAIDPFLLHVIELIQTWVWWDLLDAGDMFHFDCQLDRIEALRVEQPNERILAYYRQIVPRPPEKEIDQKDIIDFEFHRAADLVGMFKHRREMDEDHQGIIAMQAPDERYAEPEVVQLAQHVRAADSLRNSEQVDPNLREYYSRALHCTPDHVTRDHALEFEQRHLTQAKLDLAELLHLTGRRGIPYDFKEWQMEGIQERLELLRAEVDPQPRYQPPTVEEPKPE